METPLATVPIEDGTKGPPLPALRPLSMGEILDRALQIFRGSFGRLLTVMLVFQAPMYALQKGFTALLQDKAPALARPGAFQGVVPDAAQLAWVLIGGAVFAFLAMLLYELAVAGLVSGAGRAFLGERIEPGRALRESMARSPQVIGTFLLTWLWVSLLLLLSALPGAGLIAASFVFDSPVARIGAALGGLALSCLALLVVGLYLLLRYALVAEVVMIERLSLVGAMRRSARLMAGRVGPSFFESCKLRASIVYLVTFCISVSVSVVASMPTWLVYAAYDVSPLNPESFDPTLVPLWALLPAELFGVLCQAAVTPFGLLAMIVFYFDVRIRREGYDLELLASRVSGDR